MYVGAWGKGKYFFNTFLLTREVKTTCMKEMFNFLLTKTCFTLQQILTGRDYETGIKLAPSGDYEMRLHQQRTYHEGYYLISAKYLKRGSTVPSCLVQQIVTIRTEFIIMMSKLCLSKI